MTKSKGYITYILAAAFLIYCDSSFSTTATLGNIASSLKTSLINVGLLITAGSYVAGLSFAVAAIMKFKQHKDNPTQIPIGTPISLVLIAAALIFFPTIYKTIGKSIFGDATVTTGSSALKAGSKESGGGDNNSGGGDNNSGGGDNNSGGGGDSNNSGENNAEKAAESLEFM